MFSYLFSKLEDTEFHEVLSSAKLNREISKQMNAPKGIIPDNSTPINTSQNDINNLVKPVEKNGKVLTHKDSSKEGVKEFWCSTFIQKENVLLKGERDNQHEDKRSAMIVLFDCESGEIRGGSTVRNEVTQRAGTDIV